MKIVSRAIIIAIFLSIFPITYFVVSTAPAPYAVSSSVHMVKETHRICPVDDCSSYPDPSEIQGVTIATLQNWLLYVQSAEAQIRALKAWNANCVRLQVQQDRLLVHNHIDHVYLRAVRTIVHYALTHHKCVILNAQTELAVGYWRNEPMPTATTYKFWRVMTGFYRHKTQIIFDLFNEPRSPHPWNGDWSEWRAKFQALVDYVRSHGSLNQIWVEGENWASTLQGVPILRGQGIVYSYHHPGCPHPGSCGGPKGKQGLTVAIWEQDFGYLTPAIPVVDGEIVNYLGGYYWAHSTERFTRYLEFLHYHHIGIVSWTLQPGIMTRSDIHVPMNEPISAGKLFMRYYWHRLVFNKTPYAVAEG